jgi:ketosteroid isomerase-like protein
MKKLFLLGLTVLLLISCKNGEETKDNNAEVVDAKAILTTLEFDNAETSLQLVQNYVQALQEGDVDKMNAQLDEKVVILGLGGSLDSLTIADHKDYYTTSTSQNTHAISQDLYLPVKVENNWNEGEWVLSWGTNTITNKESGNKFDIPYHIVSMVENGKIVYMRYFYDMLNVVSKQGYTITPPEAAE